MTMLTKPYIVSQRGDGGVYYGPRAFLILYMNRRGMVARAMVMLMPAGIFWYRIARHVFMIRGISCHDALWHHRVHLRRMYGKLPQRKRIALGG